MCFTDPPYNVGFNGRSGKFEVFENDNLPTDAFQTFIDAVIERIKELNIQQIYIWCNWHFYGILQNKFNYNACIVWGKNVLEWDTDIDINTNFVCFPVKLIKI